MKIKAIIFDLDNTLYPESHYFQQIFERFCFENKISLSTFDFLFKDFDHFRFNKKDIFGFALNKAGIFTKDHHDKLFGYYTSIDCKLTPYPGVIEWLEYCSTNGIKMGVLTNGIPTAQMNKWKCLNLFPYDILFQSASLYPEEKPSPIPFNAIMKTMDTRFSETVFVGDRFENDVEYGHKNGSKCILVNSLPTDGIVCLPSVKDAFNYFKEIVEKSF